MLALTATPDRTDAQPILSLDDHGRASLAAVVGRFRRFYEERRQSALVVEKPNARMAKVDELADADVQRVMLEMPFEKFERRRYLKYDRDLAFVRFEPNLWRQLKHEDLTRLREICEARVREYYERVGGGGALEQESHGKKI